MKISRHIWMCNIINYLSVSPSWCQLFQISIFIFLIANKWYFSILSYSLTWKSPNCNFVVYVCRYQVPIRTSCTYRTMEFQRKQSGLWGCCDHRIHRKDFVLEILILPHSKGECGWHWWCFPSLKISGRSLCIGNFYFVNELIISLFLAL